MTSEITDSGTESEWVGGGATAADVIADIARPMSAMSGALIRSATAADVIADIARDSTARKMNTSGNRLTSISAGTTGSPS